MLVGRAAECARIDEVVDSARGGGSGALVFIGEPGIGKTALLRYARERAGGMCVLSACGIEAESEFPFAGLSQLFSPVLGRLAHLPARQRGALAAALGLAGGDHTDRFAVCVATLSLMAAVATDHPVLACVDDVQWLDVASQEALAFAARRLGADGIAVLFALRDSDVEKAQSGWWMPLPQIRLSGIEHEPAHTLVGSVAERIVPAAVVDGLYASTSGNPLALIELAQTLDDDQIAGRAPLEEPLRAGARIERAFRRRIDGLPTRVQDALLLAATTDSGALDELAAAARRIRIEPAEPLEAAEAAGIVSLQRGRVEFRHPLLRSVAYHTRSPAERRAAHAAFAEVLTGPGVESRRAWHLAAASVEPDERIADELERAALEARRRGAPAAAARALEAAARLTPDRPTSARRLFSAGESFNAGGRAEQGQPLLEEALELADDPILVAKIEQDRARAALMREPLRTGRERLLAAAERVQPYDRALASLLLSDAASACAMAGEMRSLVTIAQRAHELAQPVGGLPVLVATFYRATGLLAVGEAPRAEPLLEGLLPLVDDDAVAGAWLPATVGYLLLFFERHEQAQGLLQRVVRRARLTGMLEVLPYALATLAHAQLRCGEGLAAYAHATESVTLAEDTGQSGELANSLFVLTLVHAVRGDTRGRESAARSLELADRFGIGSMGVMTRAAWGLLELGLGHVDAAIDQLEYARRRAAEAEVIEPAIARWAPDLIEAYVYAHRLEDARSELAAFEQVARRTARIGALAAAARCRGLCASPRQYDASFQHALTLHAQVADPFERARTELCFGERLRRAKRRSEARRWLDQALGTFERLGARPWPSAPGESLRLRASARDRVASPLPIVSRPKSYRWR